MNLLISPNIISKFIFLWLSKTKTNKKIPMTVFIVSSKSRSKQSLLIVFGEPAMEPEGIKHDPKHSRWLRANRHASRDIQTPAWFDPRSLVLLKTSVFPLGFLQVEHSQFLPLFLCDMGSPLNRLQMVNVSGRHITRSC